MPRNLCKSFALVLAALAVSAPAAVASTLPELPLKQGQSAFTAGFVHAAYDSALTDQLSVGGTVGLPLGMWTAGGWNALGGIDVGARATYRIANLDQGIQWGVSGGVSSFLGGTALLPGISVFAGPHVRAPLPITLPKGQSVIARGALNLAFNPFLPSVPLAGVSPLGFGAALEVAWRYTKNEEITLSNDGFIGYRRII
jgi:hypothetical protein